MDTKTIQTYSRELVLRIQNGNLEHSSFKELIALHQERLYWQIRRMVKNHEDTQDVLQLVFVKIWKAIPNFRFDAEFSTWSFRITHNETVTFLKKRNKRNEVDEPTLYLEGQASHDIDGEEVERLLFLALETLPDKQRLVFECRYFEDKSFAEIEELTGTSIGALKASYHHAQKKIKDFLSDY